MKVYDDQISNQCIKVFQKKLNTKLNLREQLSCKDYEQTNSKNISHFQKKNQLFLNDFQ
jgi:hypothetical protein